MTVNGNVAQTNGDFTFASTNNGLSNGANTFTVIAANYYGVSSTNILSVNLPTTVTFQYDTNGNLTSDGTRNFVYDAENQLTNVYVTNVWLTQFVYDGLRRRRIEKDFAWHGSAWVQTNEIHYVYDGMLVIQERASNNTVQVTYTRGQDLSGTRQGAGGIGGLLARTDANGSAYYHADGAGNITALIDGNQNITARYEYDPFGKLIGKWGPLADANHYRFSSKEVHSLSGLYSYGYRFYEPNFQRWLNRDPIQESGGNNLYRFAMNGPFNWIDPDGFSPTHAMIWQDGPDTTSPVVNVETTWLASLPLDEQLEIDRIGNLPWYQKLAGGLLGLTGTEEIKTGDSPTPISNWIRDAVTPDRRFANIKGGTVLPVGPGEWEELLENIKGMPGTYKVCLNNGKKYVGKAVDIAKRLRRHVSSGKWSWEDIKSIFAEGADTEAMRRTREMQRLMEETGGEHPSESPNVINKNLPPKPK